MIFKKGFMFNIIFFIIISLIIIGGVLFFYISKNVIGYTEYEVDYIVGDYAGFNLDEDAIHFGTITQGVKSTRAIDIYTDRDAEVRVYVTGLGHLAISDDVFFLGANEKKSIDIVLQVPPELKEGHYSGKIRIIYRKP
tara:strand:+ start:654 stop:1067 length:414 start_codon:yes stop_codon:yes gene_type:complete